MNSFGKYINLFVRDQRTHDYIDFISSGGALQLFDISTRLSSN